MHVEFTIGLNWIEFCCHIFAAICFMVCGVMMGKSEKDSMPTDQQSFVFAGFFCIGFVLQAIAAHL